MDADLLLYLGDAMRGVPLIEVCVRVCVCWVCVACQLLFNRTTIRCGFNVGLSVQLCPSAEFVSGSFRVSFGQNFALRWSLRVGGGVGVFDTILLVVVVEVQ